jgi:hypothetical protein
MKDSPSLEDFPIRPQIMLGESLAGYCWRIYSENGHAVCDRIRMAVKAVRFDEEAQSLLLAFLGEDVLNEVRSRQEKALEWWNAYTGPKWYSLAKSPRLCPACIAETGFHAFLWDLPFVKACPIHGLGLLPHCPNCGERFGWHSLRPGWICRCGLHISDHQGASAPSADVQFAKILSGANGAYVSERMRHSGIQNLLGATAYETHHVYEMLWWLHRIRRSLTVRQPGPRHMAAKLATEAGAAPVPTAADIKHLTLQPGIAGAKVQRALRWQVRNSMCMLIDFQEADFIQRLQDVLNALEHSGNPVARVLFEQIGTTVAACSAGVDGAEQLIVHPRLTGNRRQQILQAFEHWWGIFASGIPILRQEDQRSLVDPSCNLGRSEEDDPSYWLTIVNVFFAVANEQLPASVLATMQRRWHIPPRLCQPSNPVSDVINYLRSLHQDELCFLMLMLGDAAAPYLKT